MRSTKRNGIKILVLVVLTAGSLIVQSASEAHQIQLKPLERREVQISINDFSLVDENSRAFQFNKLKGSVIVVAFIYTTCPDLCPLITATLRQVQSSFTVEERKRVFLLTITTDPEIDSPKILRGYAKRHGADLTNWSFLTGDEATLKKVWKNFGVGVNRKARGLVDHTPLTAVIDRQGKMRFAHIGAAPNTTLILKDARALLAVDR